jgi:hypothetical protein
MKICSIVRTLVLVEMISLVGCSKNRVASGSCPPTTSPANNAAHISTDDWKLMKLRDDYVEHEGPLGRGHKFEQVVTELAARMSRGERYSAKEIGDLLGPPDYVDQRDPDRLRFAYLYDRAAKKDRAVHFTFDANRMSVKAGMNSRDANSYAGWSSLGEPLDVPSTKRN